MNDAERVVEKVAEKLGEASEALKPLAETIVREYTALHIAWAAVLWGALVICLGLIIWLAIWTKKNVEKGDFWEEPAPGVPLLFLLVGTVTFLFVGGYHLTCALSPHYQIAKELLG